MFDDKEISAELTIVGESPEEMKNANIIDEFKTPSSESYLVDIGAFEDGMRMYVMAERFASTGWKWSNSFPEMDAWQLADYLDGCAKLPNAHDWEDYDDYCSGLIRISEKLKEMGKAVDGRCHHGLYDQQHIPRCWTSHEKCKTS